MNQETKTKEAKSWTPWFWELGAMIFACAILTVLWDIKEKVHDIALEAAATSIIAAHIMRGDQSLISAEEIEAEQRRTEKLKKDYK